MSTTTSKLLRALLLCCLVAAVGAGCGSSIPFGGALLQSPHWSPDGKQLAFVGWSGIRFDSRLPKHYAVVLYDVASGKRENLVRSNLPLSTLTWGPKGKRLAFLQVLKGATAEGAVGVRLSLMLYDIQQGSSEECCILASCDERDAEADMWGDSVYYYIPRVRSPLLWRPNTEMLTYTTSSDVGDGWEGPASSPGVYEVDVRTNEVSLLVDDTVSISPEFVEACAWSPDGEWLVCFHRHGGTVFAMSMVDGEIRKLYESEGVAATVFVDWFPDGESLLLTDAANLPARILRVHIQSGEVETYVEEKERPMSCSVTLSPDGGTIAYVRKSDPEGTPNEVVTLDLGTKQETTLTVLKAGAYIYPPAWSPDGRWIASYVSERRPTMARHFVLMVSPDGKRTRKIDFGL